MPWNEVMHKFGKGGLHSGSKTGPTVKGRDQAIAIMLSEKRAAEGGKSEYKSNLPNGVTLTPKGDIGQHRGVEAKIAAPFKGTQIMSASKYFKGK